MWGRVVGVFLLLWVGTWTENCSISVLEDAETGVDGKMRVECECGPGCEAVLTQRSPDGGETLVAEVRLHIPVHKLACHCASTNQKFHLEPDGRIVPSPVSLESTEQGREISPMTFALLVVGSGGVVAVFFLTPLLVCHFRAKPKPQSVTSEPRPNKSPLPEPKEVTDGTQCDETTALSEESTDETQSQTQKEEEKNLTECSDHTTQSPRTGSEHKSPLLTKISLTKSEELITWQRTPANLKYPTPLNK